MGTLVTNKLITRGLGATRLVANQAGPIVQGYGGPPSFVVQALSGRPARLRLGQSGTKRRLDQLDEVIVWAKLVEANGKVPTRDVKGWIRVKVDRDRGFASVMVEHVSTRVREAWEFIRVHVRRLK